MSVTSVAEMDDAFAERAFDRVLGTAEASWVDFKSQPYLLQNQRGTAELCKDVAAFANAGGGLIVVGVLTARSPNDTTERASELRPCPAPMLMVDQHRDRIADGVVPAIDGLRIQYHPAGDQHGYLVISIPSQNADTRPFLVKYLFDGDGTRIHGFGWPVRVADAVTWQPCETFQSRLSMSGLLQLAVANARPRREPSPEMLTRYRRLVDAVDDSAAILAIEIVPPRPIDITSAMYGTSGLADVVRTRQPLRPRGFNTIPQLNADMRGARGIEWGATRRAAVDFDALVIGIIPASGSGLAWAMDEAHAPTAINPIVLLEWTNDLFRLFYEVVLPRAGSSHDQWTVSIVADGLATSGALLASGWPRFFHSEEAHSATSDDFRRDGIELSGAPNVDTFAVLSVFYALFGLGAEAIPFCQNGAFSPAAFLEQTRR